MNKPEMQDKSMETENNGFNINADENVDGNQHLNEPVAEESETETLKEQIAQLNDKYLRQAAEFDNFRRRTAKERVELIQTASKDLIKDLLDVLDDSNRAQEQLEKTDDIAQIKEGVNLVFNKFRNTLTAKGLKPMDAVGTEFDPDLHDAVTEIDAGEDMKGKVVAEVQKGYYLQDKIIRHAKVVVGR
ncbi:nucleotide exchange factor GrpE [Flavisolibacter nicotianae]|uniref:nucleotide exchange factor GrpE n=1 Tax=Flavisolibacter nicotianae TaxID=2364882 RepID=UPI001F09BE14|nr:nucleotide exchange factor GrpE [Flavisolibacter nicotianae]